MKILEKIVRQKQKEVALLKRRIPLKDLKQKCAISAAKKYSLIEKMKDSAEFRFICEVKRASPSAGWIRHEVDPAGRAKAYAAGGAAAISVLTDRHFFNGRQEDLTQIRHEVDLPLLRKDFIIDEYQVWESALMGADLILLIVRILDTDQLERFLKLASELGLEVLVELHGEKDIEKLPAHIEKLPVILGVNNRNLDTFEVDLNHSIKMTGYLPHGLPAISESGVKSAKDCVQLKTHGFKGVLIGEALMRQQDPGKFLRHLREATGHVYTS
ncbi:indole-3-glycerol phosphate synthase TrpC [Calditrichota bacterium LG25]